MKSPGQCWLIVTHYYPPEIGAPQIRLSALARELQRNGKEVEVLTALPNYPTGRIFPGYQGRVFHRETVKEIPVRRTWIYAATGKSIRRVANYASFSLTALGPALFGRRPDLLFVDSRPTIGLVGLAMKWLRGVPYIYNVPDLSVQVAAQHGVTRNRRLLGVGAWMERLFLRHAWKVSTVTHAFVEHLEELGVPRERITFLPNGADTEFLRPQPPCPELLQRWGLAGKKVFAYVGTHAYYHGLDVILDAAERLRDHPEIAFLLVGNGPERQRLRELGAERNLTNVVFGDSPYEEMARLYSITYAAVATIRNMEVAQGMRLAKVFPALSCGVPVLHSGRGECGEILEQHGCGLSTAPEDPLALADAVLALANDPERRERMGTAGRHLIEEEYSWQFLVRRWLDELGNPDPVGERAIVA
jgi:glycosyltransferase involved in cell wall biosynthesis